MRTTITIDDSLLAEAKAQAARSGKSVSAFVEDAVRQALARRPHAPTHRRVRVPTFRGDGLQPGVDLSDSAALWDLTEGSAR